MNHILSCSILCYNLSKHYKTRTSVALNRYDRIVTCIFLGSVGFVKQNLQWYKLVFTNSFVGGFAILYTMHIKLLRTIYSAVFFHRNTDPLLETLSGGYAQERESDAKQCAIITSKCFDELYGELIIQVRRKTRLTIVTYRLFNFSWFVRAAFHWSWWTAACFSPMTKKI